MRVVGIDIWQRRWLAVVLDDGQFAEAHVEHGLADLLAVVSDAAVIAVDVPIGLPALGSRRQADDEARQLVGKRGSSVFTTPARELLLESSVQAANILGRKHKAAGISAQAFSLRTAILEAEPLAADDERIFEVHPEVSFCVAAKAPLPHSKTSWNGQNHRLQLLRKHGIKLPPNVPSIGEGGVTDVMDAAIGAWSAHRIATRQATRLPAGTERGPAIWA